MPSLPQTTDGQGDLLGLIRPTSPAPETLAILDLINGDPIHANDRRRIVEAILGDARRHAGDVDPGRVREDLTNEWGLTVYSRVLSATYQALTRRGVLTFRCWVDNTDVTGGNAGKPARAYTLANWRAAA
jgi:hypothetical protein